MSIFSYISQDYRSAFTSEINFFGFIYRFFFDPGFQAVVLFRLYSHMYAKGYVLKIFAKVLWRLNVFINSCYLMPGASVGPGLYLPHPVGVVVGEGVSIGVGVTLYQCVTVGVVKRGSSEYPTIGDNCVIYTGACIVGGIFVSSNSIISAHQFIKS